MRIDNRLNERAALAWFELDGIEVQPGSDALRSAVDRRIEELRRQYSTPADATELLAPARELYRSFGIDPSKRRPASEALLRRILQGKGLYRVNTAVDSANLASLSYFLPVGLYDVDKLTAARGELVFRLGESHESYAGIGKGEIHLADRPALFDDDGPFGNPSSDSFRTRITLGCRRLLFTIFARAGEDPLELERFLAESREILQRFLGGRVR